MSNAALSAKTIMVQGTTSDAGKSIFVAALCRCLKQQGINNAPFKPQNMALNSVVTEDGGEIGRAQAVQAQAAGLAPTVDMNPVLLKPSSDTGAQIIIHGKVVSDMQAKAYHDYKTVAMNAVLESHKRLEQSYDVIVVEGAGSPAEINLRDRDIANMGFAEAVDCPVIIIADIDRGGVFAQLVGTLDLLSPSEQNRVKGFVINKFRGDISLLQPGIDWLEERTKKPVLGVLPYLMDLQLAAEDAINAEQAVNPKDQRLVIAVPVFSRISNHTDFDMLRIHPQVELHFVRQGDSIPGCDLIILPGSKNVRSDLQLLRDSNWDADINKHLRYGGKVLGICGGYQMLGQTVCDPTGIEGSIGTSQGLGLLPVTTELTETKQLTQDTGHLLLSSTPKSKNTPITGYQIHVGKTQLAVNAHAMIQLNDGTFDGCISDDNQVAGSYFHGLFDTPEALSEILLWAGAKVDVIETYQSHQEKQLDYLANACHKHVNWHALHNIIGIEATLP
ncbi:cobyric acid synthase [Alteromonas sp. 5E99-2]|uniref:cobyric acid synthase n=1 Tax=Alteromonas sp. 5E99-2 TaxID=2817683 RepID=UPI001A997FCC|nr:cobyric acid synthase [Alteromonas sp. 5E99-2]MBO1255375.1 cobyric acid synthase [Alteromonas sp. 5E99-2]